LSTGHLAGAALDAFQQEPPDADNPLLTLPQVIPTPHMGAHSDGATNAMGSMALAECLAVLAGKQPRYRVV
jgi:phosphoglycerate dehydrogenase-like enzyme